MDYKATFTDGSELYFLAHYGIPKMQWGVRRYQNKDGSLTPEGREHYGVGSKRFENMTNSERAAKSNQLTDKLIGVNKNRAGSSGRYKYGGRVVGGLAGGLAGATIGLAGGPQISGAGAGIGLAIGKQIGESIGKKIDAEKAKKQSVSNIDLESKEEPVSDKLAKHYKESAANYKSEQFGKAKAALNDSAYDGLRNELGLSKNQFFDYAMKALKNYNEYMDIDHVLFQHLDEPLAAYQNKQISKKTFDDLYDGEAAHELTNFLGWCDTSYQLKQIRDYTPTGSERGGRLSSWFGNDPLLNPDLQGTKTDPDSRNRTAESRRAYSLRAQGLTYAEIGEKLGIDETTAWNLLNI